VSTPLPDFVSDFPKAAAGREPGYSRVGTARWHHAAYSSTVRQNQYHGYHHAGRQAAGTVPCTAVQAGRQKSRGLANSSQIRYEAQEALQASQGSPKAPEAILDICLRSLEAFPGQGRMAESQFRPLPVPRCPGTTYHARHQQRLSGKSRNRGRLPLPSTL
jgi:hypothetical protein